MSGIGSISSKKLLTGLGAIVGVILAVWLVLKIVGFAAALLGFLVKAVIFVIIAAGAVWLVRKFMQSRD